MTADAFIERARGWGRLLEDRERARSGEPLKRAREAVARRIAVPPGTLENLRKNRLKAIAAHWYDRLRSGVIRELEAELAHVDFQLQIARQTGLDPRDRETEALVASHARLSEALGRSAPPIAATILANDQDVPPTMEGAAEP